MVRRREFLSPYEKFGLIVAVSSEQAEQSVGASEPLVDVGDLGDVTWDSTAQ